MATWMEQQARATERHPEVDVDYASNLRAGDWYAGRVVLDAPTRPVQPFAKARHVTGVELFTDDEGRKMARVRAAGPEIIQPSPVPAYSLVLVIRGL